MADLMIMIGIPGAGKSTWCKENIKSPMQKYVSRDEIRFSLLKEDEDYFAHENEVVKLWFEKVSEAILNSEIENIYIDATHLTERARKNTINELPEGDYDIITVFFQIPLEICLNRNSKREGRAFVPPSVIRSMWESYNCSTDLTDAIYVGLEGNE